MKYILSVLMVVVGVQLATAQDVYTSSGRPEYAKKKEKKKTGYDPSRLIVGGGLVAGFGSGYTDVGIFPVVGYRITERFSAGVGLGYEFQKQSYYLTDPGPSAAVNLYSSHANIISPSIWARHFIYNNIFLTGIFEYNFQYLNGAVDDPVQGKILNESYNVNAPCLLLGGGIKQPLGGRVSVLAEILYDVLQQPNSPYLNQPVVHFGIVAGI
jgi:hypothetical protein